MEKEKIIFDEKDVSDNKGLAVLMVLTGLFFIPLLMEEKKRSPYLMFYANQLLLFFLSSVILCFSSTMLTAMTFGILFFVPFIVLIYLLIAWIILIVGVCSGEASKLPIAGDIVIIK